MSGLRRLFSKLMDPFVFDQRFARFLGQVDTSAAARGTELYEAGSARVISVASSVIRGSVEERREGAFQVSLAVNDEGGLSSSCSCPEFFNCSHGYALARAARDQIVGRSEKRSERAVVAREKSPEMVELERVWKLARDSGYLLYPKDLYKLAADRKGFGPISREPIRDLKRALASSQPKSAGEFGGVLQQYFAEKGIRAAAGFSQKDYPLPEKGSTVPANEDKSWDRPPLQLRARIELEESPDRDWFQASASWDVEGEDLTAKEIDRLRAAKGGLVKLEGRGWLRLDLKLPDTESRALAALGLDPARGNSQRVHLCQLEDLLPEETLCKSDFVKLKRRAAALNDEVAPILPKKLQGVLRPYQTAGFGFLCRLSRWQLGGILADDMGLGKTLQTLAWMLWLAQEKTGEFKALVVCPKSVTDNWVQEPVKFQTGLTARSYRKAGDSLAGANIVVANYAQLRINADAFLAEDWDAVVLDEAQYIKSPTSQTSKIAFKLKGRNRLALTGTPIENSLTDLWSLMRFAMPRLFGPLPSFQANYSAAKGEGALLDLRTRMRPFMLRRLKSEVAEDLPERIEKDVFCELEGSQRELYDEHLEAARSLLKSGGGGAFNVLQALLRLRQICCDPRLLDTGSAPESVESAKLDALFDLLEPLVAEGHKVLVFSQFVQMLEIVERELKKRDMSSLKLTGKSKNRGALVQRFQEGGEEQVFLLSLKAAGSGLTLTAASYVILLDPWWNPAVEAQAIDRVHRIGQTDQVIAYRILAKDTVEGKIRKIQEEKSELAAALFGEGVLGAKIGLDELEALLS